MYKRQISNDEGKLSIINTTIAENFGGGRSGGLALGEGEVEVVNSIVWGNRAEEGTREEQQILHASGTLLLSHSTVEGLDRLNAVSSYALDPLFVDPVRGDYRLSPHSPLINQGTQVSIAMDLDLAGEARVFDDPAVVDDGVDLGAFETALPPQASLSLISQPRALACLLYTSDAADES